MHRLATFAATSLLAALLACGGNATETPMPNGAATTSTTVPPTTTTVAAAAGECGLEGGYPQPWPERPRYEVRLVADPEAGVVTGEMEVRFTATEATDRLVFRLWANGPRSGREGGRIEVTEALLDGEPTETGYESGGAAPGTPGTVFTMRADVRPGVPVDAFLAFRLDMPGAINDRIAHVGDSLRLGSILPTLSWIRGEGWHTSPAVDAFSEAVASEVADYDVRVEVPDGYTVLATGTEEEPGRFVATAVRDWAASIGRFDLAEARSGNGRTRVVVGVHEGLGEDARARLATTVDALDEMSARYGPYPYPELTVGITGSLSGGIEFPQHIHFGAGTSTDSLVHEVAHMWFYALVGNDQYGDPWLDEGVTEYAERRHMDTLGAARATTIPVAGKGRMGAGHDYWASHTGAFHRSVYVQGAAMLAALGDQVGGLEALDCALRRYVLGHAYGVAEADDFVDAVVDQTGFDPRPHLRSYGIDV